jgi:hypothetical protein
MEVEAQGGDGAGHPYSYKGCLFFGGNQYEGFMDCLHCIIEKYPDEFVLGFSPGNLGLHSARKGASSHACSGTTALPPMVSICLHAMWSMGHVKEWYLQFEKAGDQYLGQVVCGLDVNSVKFAVSPPFFDFDGTKLDNGTSPIVYSLLMDYMVCGQSVSTSVHRIFYFCFASLCFHFDFLTQVLHKKNKLQASHFFQHIPSNIQAAATVKYPWTKTEVTPTLTSLPPHITIMANFEQLRLEMEETKNAILSGVEAVLDKRHIGSQSYFVKEEIVSWMLLLHNKLLKKVDVCVCS